MLVGKEDARRHDQSDKPKSLRESREADYACRDMALCEAKHRYADNHKYKDENGCLLSTSSVQYTSPSGLSVILTQMSAAGSDGHASTTAASSGSVRKSGACEVK